MSRKLSDDELLFGECQSVIIVSIEENNLHELVSMANDLNVYTQTIGKVTSGDKLIINALIDIDRDLLHKAYYDSIKDIME